jgi:hypothetical protein
VTTLPLGYGLVVLALGLLCGGVDSRRLHSLDVREVGHRAPYLYVIVPLSLLALAGDILLQRDPTWQWRVPDWLLVYYVPLSRGMVVLNLAYMVGLSSGLTFRTGHAGRWTVLVAGVLSLAASLLFQYEYSRPISVGPPRTLDGVVLQTNESTCGAAAAASIANWLGRSETEADMVRIMGTTALGTSPAQVLYGLRRIGLRAHVVTSGNVMKLHPPAILFVASSSLGAEAHAVALVGFQERVGLVLDPSIGRRFIYAGALNYLWRGHAIEVSR